MNAKKTHLENGKIEFAKDTSKSVGGKKIKESEIVEQIKLCIDQLDADGLAEIYNSFYEDANITGDDIIPYGDE